MYDCIVIGGGSGGLSCCIQLSKDGLKKILLIEKERELGGILNQCIHNGFGLIEYNEELTGCEYAYKQIQQILDDPSITILTETTVIDISKDKKVTIQNKNGIQILDAKIIITSTGSYERTRGMIRLNGTRPIGVMNAGVAQKYLNVDGVNNSKRVFILGSGDIGLIMARRMSLSGCKVIGVAEINSYSSGLPRNIAQCLEDFNIPLYTNTTVKEVIGDKYLEKIILSKVDSNYQFIEGSEFEVEVDTLLLSVGLIPYNPLLEKIGVVIDKQTKGPLIDSYYQTSIDGIFACGNSLHIHDLVDYVTKESYECAHFAYLKYHNLLDTSVSFEITCNELISYLIPKKVYPNSKITLKFRVKQPLGKCVINIYDQSKQIIKTVKKMYLNPSEMNLIEVENVYSNLYVEIICND